MSGIYPLTPPIAGIELSSYQPTVQAITQSGRRNIRQMGAHLWALKFNYNKMTKDEFMPLNAFINSQEGRFGTFDVVSPDLATPQGSALGTPVVNGASQVGKSLSTSGWANNSLVLKAGDIFKPVGQNKVYMVTSDVTSDGTGLATINFIPALISSPSNLEQLVVNNVPFKMQINSDKSVYNVSSPLIYDFSVTMTEVI